MNCLFILRQSPYQGSLAREALDMALAFAAFDEHVQLLFLEDGVFQLLKNQDSDGLRIKNMEKSLAATGIYDINDIYVGADCLTMRGLSTDTLTIAAQAVEQEDIQQLIAHADKVVSL